MAVIMVNAFFVNFMVKTEAKTKKSSIRYELKQNKNGITISKTKSTAVLFRKKQKNKAFIFIFNDLIA